MVPEKEGGWKQSRGIQRLEIETVLKRGILTFGPFPDEDIIELMSDSVLDGNKVALIPIPKIKYAQNISVLRNNINKMEINSVKLHQ